MSRISKENSLNEQRIVHPKRMILSWLTLPQLFKKRVQLPFPLKKIQWIWC